MKRIEELIIGVLLFYLVDRVSRFVSATVARNRDMSDLETEKFRCTTETIAMLSVFALLWVRLKR